MVDSLQLGNWGLSYYPAGENLSCWFLQENMSIPELMVHSVPEKTADDADVEMSTSIEFERLN